LRKELAEKATHEQLLARHAEQRKALAEALVQVNNVVDSNLRYITIA